MFEYVIRGVVTPKQIADLRRSVGWNGMEDSYSRSLANSYFYICCYDEKLLVGFLDVVSNGVTDAYIQDVVVRPGHQKKGIGTEMMNMAIKKLKQDGVFAISVLFEKKLKKYYKKFGFHMFLAGQMSTREEI